MLLHTHTLTHTAVLGQEPLYQNVPRTRVRNAKAVYPMAGGQRSRLIWKRATPLGYAHVCSVLNQPSQVMTEAAAFYLFVLYTLTTKQCFVPWTVFTDQETGSGKLTPGPRSQQGSELGLKSKKHGGLQCPHLSPAGLWATGPSLCRPLQELLSLPRRGRSWSTFPLPSPFSSRNIREVKCKMWGPWGLPSPDKPWANPMPVLYLQKAPSASSSQALGHLASLALELQAKGHSTPPL